MLDQDIVQPRYDTVLTTAMMQGIRSLSHCYHQESSKLCDSIVLQGEL